ncbi:MAG: cobyrinate a,c-diamide synthase [Anaerolineales bacterium]|nr:cobyrinate a,c-diamide synthase [Anaerolineales bacterium]
MSTISRLVISAPASGSGKSLVAAGLMAAFSRRLSVQGFKVGPDYIDPMYHSAATGRPSRNLDTWMLAPEIVRRSFARACVGADLAVIEGVMGLFDGSGPDPLEGSTAGVARLLAAPIVLVVDCGAMSASAAAVVHGFQTYVPGVTVAGVICNRVGGERHGAWLRESIEALGVPVLGLLPFLADLKVPERHLGLFTVAERPDAVRAFMGRLAEVMARHIDLAALEALASRAEAFTPEPEPEEVATHKVGPTLRLAVAEDEAFCFYYEDNLDALRRSGAEIVPFSPLRDSRLPEGIAGLYLGGGYPELYAAQLAANLPMRREILAAHRRGLPIYAECGGLMYLTEGIDLTMGYYPLVGVLPGRCTMGDRLRIGYRDIEVAQPGLLGLTGARLRGHEYHYSHWQSSELERAAYRVVPQFPGEPARFEGYVDGRLHASYVHVHFGQQPALADRIVDACRDWHAEQGHDR